MGTKQGMSHGVLRGSAGPRSAWEMAQPRWPNPDVNVEGAIHLGLEGVVELLRADHPVVVVVERPQQLRDDRSVLHRPDLAHGLGHNGVERGVRQLA